MWHGAAPFRPKINHDGLGLARSQHFRIEVSVIHRKNIFSHNLCVLFGLQLGSHFPD